MAITQVMKMTDYTSGRPVPLTPLAMEGFPWAAACSLCPWGTSLGGWRDTFDFAFTHARGHVIDQANGKHAVAANQAVMEAIVDQVLDEIREDDTDDGSGEDPLTGRWGY